MNRYESLLQEAHEISVPVYDKYRFRSPNIKGIYCNGSIALNREISHTAERTCILAEELGHHYTSVGDIIDQSKTENRKQERKARLHAYRRYVTLENLLDAKKCGCSNRFEVANHLEITEAFLQDALDKFKEIYGISHCESGYLIIFEPLDIFKIPAYLQSVAN